MLETPNPLHYPLPSRDIVVSASWNAVYWRGDLHALDESLHGQSLHRASAHDGVVTFTDARAVEDSALDRDGSCARAFSVLNELPRCPDFHDAPRPGTAHTSSSVALFAPLKFLVFLHHRGVLSVSATQARAFVVPVEQDNRVSWSEAVPLDYVELVEQHARALQRLTAILLDDEDARLRAAARAERTRCS